MVGLQGRAPCAVEPENVLQQARETLVGLKASARLPA
jgi:hypothetical protein